MAVTGQFDVPANVETGFEFTHSGNSTVAYTFSATGTWTVPKTNWAATEYTAEGFAGLPPDKQYMIKAGWPTIDENVKYRGKSPFSLVAENTKTTLVTAVGKKATIVMKPGEILRFANNDMAGTYAGNSGSIKVAWSSVNLENYVMQFDGNADYILLPEMDIDYSGGFTVEAWVRFDKFKKFTRIIELSKDKQQEWIALYCGENNNNLRFSVDINNGQKHYLIEAVSALEAQKWTHVAATIDTSGNGKLYKDGKLVASEKIELPPKSKRTKNTIGGSSAGWGPRRDFEGKMAEIRIWNKARSAEEINADMSRRLSGKEPNIVGYWPLNKVRSVGSTLGVLDLTERYDGTVTGALLVDEKDLPVD